MQLLLATLLAGEASEHRAVHASVSGVARLVAVTANQVERLTEPRALVERELLDSVNLVHVTSSAVDYARLRDPTRVVRSGHGLLLVLVKRSGACRARVLATVPLADDVDLILMLLLQLNVRLRQRVLARVLGGVSHVLHLLLLAVLRRILLVQRVSILISVETGARVSQESRLRLAHLLRVLRIRRSLPLRSLLLMELSLLLLKELLLLRGLAVARAAGIEVATTRVQLLLSSVLDHALLDFTRWCHDLEGLGIE